MAKTQLPRRDFLRMLALAFPAATFTWDAFPKNNPRAKRKEDYDVIIIGAGLGGLSCAAACARQGFRPLVIEQHDKPGGYATAFARPGGFLFDASLHSMTVGERDGHVNLISEFPEITSVEFVPHPTLLRAMYPDHDLRVAQRDPAAFVEGLSATFPAERDGIAGLFADMRGLASDIGKLSRANGKVEMTTFPQEFPVLYQLHGTTWGQMMERRVHDSKLKALLSAQWGYYGLPPSKLSCYYYALPLLGYLAHGGYYPRGRSQDISNAFARYIKEHGGEILLNTKATAITTKENAATGVSVSGGKTYGARAVVSNANPFETFKHLIGASNVLKEYEDQWASYSVSLSSFQIFLGLKDDIVRRSGITDSEIFVETGYDPENAYKYAQQADVKNGGFGVTLYDNILPGYSPAGKNTLNILTLQGFDVWEPFAQDYFRGAKEAYNSLKQKMAAELIRRVEERLLPGLSAAIEVQEIGTPLTNMRYTGNHRGAIYGWDQTVNNSGSRRVGHATPIKNLFLAGAWTHPGHGYGAVIPSGVECFRELARGW